MTASTTSTLSAADGTQLLVRRWPAEGVRWWADVLLVHGIAEHSGRYEKVGEWLAGSGIAVSAFDLRGFGGSAGKRAFVERWTDYHDDLRDMLAMVRADGGDRPVAMYGHSMGGLIALGYAVSDPPRTLPDALVLSAPAIDATIPAWKRAIAGVLGSVAPTMALKNDFDGELLSRDPEVGRIYLADPANYHRTAVRLGAEAFTEQRRIKAALGRLTIPTLVYHGGQDRLVPTASSEPLGELRAVTRRTYPALRHESHNEPEGAEVVADVVVWLRSVLESADN